MVAVLVCVFLVLVIFSYEAATVTSAGIIHFSKSSLFPESMDWDAMHQNFIVGSMSLGSLFSLSLKGDVKELVRDEDYAEKAAILGVAVDLPRQRVLSVIRSLGSIPFNAVVAYDLNSGKRHFISVLDSIIDKKVGVNDVAVDSFGNAYITDSIRNIIWKVTVGGNASIFSEHSLFSSQTVISTGIGIDCGLNGIVYHQDGLLLVGQSNTGSLFRINLTTSADAVHLIQLKHPLKDVDGIRLKGDSSLIGVSSEKAWLLRSSDKWKSAYIEDEVQLDESFFATSIAIRDDQHVHVLYSYLPMFLAGKTRDMFVVEEIEFPKEAYNDPIWLLGVLGLFILLIGCWKYQMARFYKDCKKKRL